ncbi:hypothetical protein A8F94_01990 [Bacillus sp. FJAT-27225]|uniref:hypothetical protein n=1 Tax=Bacillus sp. FJAT-27225 TaxID=1743144 RepID=UPI00080C2D4D|nr:hypothetical protein [Bacillus sp. FJAT-27225]OCA90672.1 hypothetical protein A8F94_01990 [Bacillus sp. FJAT-27225]
MRIALYIGLLVLTLICSLIHVFRQAKAEERPGEIVLQTFFIAFFILGSSCLWWIFTADNEVTQALGVLTNGVFLGLDIFITLQLSFYLDSHRELFEPKAKQNQENPRYI